jgi:hypothetical protein
MDLTRSIAICSVRFLGLRCFVYEIVPFLRITETVTQESLYELTNIMHGQVLPLVEHIELGVPCLQCNFPICQKTGI